MNPKKVVVEVQPDAILMLKEFVEYNGIEYYDHNETLYKLLDALADEVVRTYTLDDGTVITDSSMIPGNENYWEV